MHVHNGLLYIAVFVKEQRLLDALRRVTHFGKLMEVRDEGHNLIERGRRFVGFPFATFVKAIMGGWGGRELPSRAGCRGTLQGPWQRFLV
jgi:hypothetical protein